MFSHMTRNTHNGEDIEEGMSWYFVLKRATPSLAAQRRTGAVEDVHCLVVSLHVTASAGVLVKLMVRMADSHERIAQRVETVFQGLVGG